LKEAEMPERRTAFLLALAVVWVQPGLASADRLDKEAQKWLDEVTPLMLPSEQKTFKDIKKEDRAEFQKIFWARRDPDPEMPKPENQFKADYLKKRADADRRYKVPGRSGAETDCGRVFILLGEPDQVKKEPRGEEGAGIRSPEVWTYKDKPSIPFKFKGGEIQIAFDESCQLPQGSRMGEQLARVAESWILRPNLEYRVGKDGRLTKLADMLPKPTPAQSLLKAPRQDFPVQVQAAFLKVADGGTALIGLVQGKAEGLNVQDAGGKKTVKVVVAAQAVGEDGRVAAFYEQPTIAEVADGAFVASYRLGVKPGKYTIHAGALDENTGKGSLTTTNVEAPDLNKGELSLSSLLIIREVEENATSDPAHPFAAYLLGGARLIPRFGAVFTKDDAVSFFYQYYDARVDESTGKASTVASLSILKGDKPVAKAADQPFDIPVGGNVVGPVPLARYEPGSYLVRLKITDNVAKKDITQEVPFEIK
jgi:GWxTD domain-containing protein